MRPLARHQIGRADRQAEFRGDRLELAGGECVVELLDPARDGRARRRRGVLAGDLRARLFEGRGAGLARLLDLDDVKPELGSHQIADLPLAQGEGRLLESGNHLSRRRTSPRSPPAGPEVSCENSRASAAKSVPALALPRTNCARSRIFFSSSAAAPSARRKRMCRA